MIFYISRYSLSNNAINPFLIESFIIRQWKWAAEGEKSILILVIISGRWLFSEPSTRVPCNQFISINSGTFYHMHTEKKKEIIDYGYESGTSGHNKQKNSLTISTFDSHDGGTFNL